MDTKVLLAAIVGFILGALLVSIAATTFEKDRLMQENTPYQSSTSNEH